MRITVQHALKVPAEEEFSSRQHSIAMEVDIPEDVVHQGKDAIRNYVAAVTAEVRSYVEEAIGRSGPVARPQADRSGSRSGPVGRAPAQTPGRGYANGHATRNGHASGNGQSTEVAAGSMAASIKQINFLRGLAKDAGYSPDQLSYLAEETTGKRDLRALTKREASQMIDQLRNGQG